MGKPAPAANGRLAPTGEHSRTNVVLSSGRPVALPGYISPKTRVMRSPTTQWTKSMACTPSPARTPDPVRRYRTLFILQVPGFAGARERVFGALAAGCSARRRGRGPRRSGWSGGCRGVRPGDYVCESWLSNPQFEILNSQFATSLRCHGPPRAWCSPAPPGATRAAWRPVGRAHASHPPADTASGCSPSSPFITEELKTISKEIRQLPLYRVE